MTKVEVDIHGLCKAFLIGGIICALAQILGQDEMMPGRVMVTLVVTGTILGAIGIYEPFAKWAGAGATVPLLGFGNTLWKGVKEGLQQDGFLGVFKGGFTSSAVGISGALIFGYLGSLIFKPKMKD
ncbi:MAG: SpoVA/SpoVAEb family sporulation membrane protein [Hungatella hathewayi]